MIIMAIFVRRATDQYVFGITEPTKKNSTIAPMKEADGSLYK